MTLQREGDQPLGIGFRKMPTPPFCQVVLLQDNSAAKLSEQVGLKDKSQEHYLPYISDACIV